MATKYEFDVKFGDETKKLIVTKPNDTQETDADIYSSQIFAKLAKEKDEDGKPAYMVRAKLDEFLRDIGIYTQEDIERLGTISSNISNYEDRLYAGQITKKQGRDLAIKLRENRYELLLLLNKKASYDVHTIEHHCQNARMDYLITKCICFENGEPVFKSVKDYKEDDVVKPLIIECITKLASLISNYDQDYEKKLPENKFLIKFNYCNDDLDLVDPETGRHVNTDGDFIDKEGNVVDEEGKPVDINGDLLDRELGDFFDEEPKPKPKRKVKRKPTETKV